MYNNQLVGWTGRHINPPNKETAKYLLNMQSGYVFNIDKFVDSERDFVVVTEGVFDAIAIDGIATLGNNINEQQADIIDSIGKEVICVPDRDQAGQEMIDYALEYGWAVSFPNWHDEVKDVSDAVGKYGKLYTMASILEGKKSNKLKINLARKKLV